MGGCATTRTDYGYINQFIMADQDLTRELEGRPCTACNFEPHGWLSRTEPRGCHPVNPEKHGFLWVC